MGIRKAILDMDGYVPGIQPDDTSIIKLNTNENPYSPPKEVMEAIKSGLDALKLYPDPNCRQLKQKLADYYGFQTDQILVGNGSDELLRMVFQATLEKGDKVVLTDPTYSLFDTLSSVQDAEAVKIPVGMNSKLPDKIPSGRLLIICNPNAPSASVFDYAQLEKVCQNFSGLVLIDEAYIDFADRDCLSLVKKFPNVMVTRTMSKSFSLAGLRIGYMFACKEIIQNLDKIKDSYNVNRLSQLAAVSAMENMFSIKQNIDKIKMERDALAVFLAKENFLVIPSQANFVFVEPKWISAQKLYEELLKKKILVRYFPVKELRNYLRITIGTKEQMDILKKEILNIKKGILSHV